MEVIVISIRSMKFEIENRVEEVKLTVNTRACDQQERDLLDRPSGIGCLSTINNLPKPCINSEYRFSRTEKLSFVISCRAVNISGETP